MVYSPCLRGDQEPISMLPQPQYGFLPQVPLFHIVHEDDVLLLNSSDAAWFKVLYYFPWRDYRVFAAKYYEALYAFNRRDAEKIEQRRSERTDEAGESEEQAKQRLLFGRPTMSKYQQQGEVSLI